MKRILFSLLMVLLAVPTFAQVDKDHDFKAGKEYGYIQCHLQESRFDVC